MTPGEFAAGTLALLAGAAFLRRRKLHSVEPVMWRAMRGAKVLATADTFPALRREVDVSRAGVIVVGPAGVRYVFCRRHATLEPMARACYQDERSRRQPRRFRVHE